MIPSLRWLGWSAAVIALTAAPLCASAPEPAPERPVFVEAPSSGDIAYVYVDGNEAGAGGGHTAIRAGESIFHYQRVPEGFFILDRMPWDGFLYSYSRLQNRNIYETPLNIKPVDQERLIYRLTELQIQHRWLLSRRAMLLDRLARLQALLESDRISVSYPVLGYFRPGRSKLWSQYRYLRFEPSEKAEESFIPGDEDDIEAHLESELQIFLKDGFDFHDDAFIVTDQPFTGVPSDALQTALVHSLQSAVHARYEFRPDRARTALEILVLMEALRRSQESGCWVLPQMAFLDESSTGQRSLLSADHPELQILASMFRSRLNLLAASLERREPSSRLVHLYNLTLQSASILDLARRKGASAVFSAGAVMWTPALSLVKERSYLDRDRVKRELALSQRQYADLESLMQDELSYSLLTKNCVTELLAELQMVTGLPSRNPVVTGIFIPFVSERYVAAALGRGEQIYYPSYRNELLRIEKNPLREMSTLSSAYYTWNDRDSWFIFFTEDRSFARPFFGIVNLLPGFLQTLIGIGSAPLDRGQRCSRGLRGMFFSMSEVAFVSVRKGTFRGGHPIFYALPSPVRVKLRSKTDDG